jgi:putative transposase
VRRRLRRAGAATASAAVGHPGGQHRVGHPQASPWQLLPGVAARAPAAQRALTSGVTEAYGLGVSTRQVEALVQVMGIQGISKPRMAELAQSLDETVESFRKPWTAPTPPSRRADPALP